MAWRSQGRGASDAAALVGLSRYVSPWSLWADKLGLTPSVRRPAPAHRHRARVGDRPTVPARAHRPARRRRADVGDAPAFDWARCTVDGFVTESPESSLDDALGVLEIKTDARYGWPDGVPVDIRSQVIWQLACTGLPQAWVAVLHGGFAFCVYEVPWDADAEADWALLRDAGERFWTDNVLAGVPPAVDGSDATRDALIAVYGDGEPGVDVSLDHLADELAEPAARLKALKGEAEERLKLLDKSGPRGDRRRRLRHARRRARAEGDHRRRQGIHRRRTHRPPARRRHPERPQAGGGREARRVPPRCLEHLPALTAVERFHLHGDVSHAGADLGATRHTAGRVRHVSMYDSGTKIQPAHLARDAWDVAELHRLDSGRIRTASTLGRFTQPDERFAVNNVRDDERMRPLRGEAFRSHSSSAKSACRVFTRRNGRNVRSTTPHARVCICQMLIGRALPRWLLPST